MLKLHQNCIGHISEWTTKFSTYLEHTKQWSETYASKIYKTIKTMICQWITFSSIVPRWMCTVLEFNQYAQNNENRSRSMNNFQRLCTIVKHMQCPRHRKCCREECDISLMDHFTAVPNAFCVLRFTSCNATTVFPSLTSFLGELFGN